VRRRFSVISLVFALIGSAPAWADDDFSIAGQYTKDEACTAAAAQRVDLRVKITRQAIESNMGVCTILNRNQDGNTFALHVECKIPGDQLILGDVTFKVRDRNTLDFDDQDHTSPAVLYRCAAK
jgi:hypothetical protein